MTTTGGKPSREKSLICHHKVPISGTNMLRWCGNAAQETEVGPRCLHHSPPPTKPPHPHGQRIRAVILADALTLSREERHEFAEMLVKHKGSWSSLSESDARRIADALEGFPIVQALLFMRTQR